jgi:hypothetical protein
MLTRLSDAIKKTEIDCGAASADHLSQCALINRDRSHSPIDAGFGPTSEMCREVRVGAPSLPLQVVDDSERAAMTLFVERGRHHETKGRIIVDLGSRSTVGECSELPRTDRQDIPDRHHDQRIVAGVP